MGWKKLPYWLKGGLIGLLVGIIYYLILYLIARLFLISIGTIPSGIPDLLVLFKNLPDFIALIPCQGFCVGEESLVTIITAPISFFIIGALIGFIISKLKKNK